MPYEPIALNHEEGHFQLGMPSINLAIERFYLQFLEYLLVATISS